MTIIRKLMYVISIFDLTRTTGSMLLYGHWSVIKGNLHILLNIN